MIVVRRATLTDLSEMVAWGKEHHPQANDGVEFNAPWFRNVLKSAMQTQSQCVFIARKAGRLCGMLVGIVSPMMWSPLFCATDQLFVADAGGKELLDAFLAWCKQMRVRRVDMGVTQMDRKGVDRFYQSRGFSRAGGMYYQNLGVAR